VTFASADEPSVTLLNSKSTAFDQFPVVSKSTAFDQVPVVSKSTAFDKVPVASVPHHRPPPLSILPFPSIISLNSHLLRDLLLPCLPLRYHHADLAVVKVNLHHRSKAPLDNCGATTCHHRRTLENKRRRLSSKKQGARRSLSTTIQLMEPSGTSSLVGAGFN
jgi:hypothetical protein